MKILDYETYDPEKNNSTVIEIYKELLKQIEVDHQKYMNFKEKNNINS